MHGPNITSSLVKTYCFMYCCIKNNYLNIQFTIELSQRIQCGITGLSSAGGLLL